SAPTTPLQLKTDRATRDLCGLYPTTIPARRIADDEVKEDCEKVPHKRSKADDKDETPLAGQGANRRARYQPGDHPDDDIMTRPIQSVQPCDFDDRIQSRDPRLHSGGPCRCSLVFGRCGHRPPASRGGSLTQTRTPAGIASELRCASNVTIAQKSGSHHVAIAMHAAFDPVSAYEGS